MGVAVVRGGGLRGAGGPQVAWRWCEGCGLVMTEAGKVPAVVGGECGHWAGRGEGGGGTLTECCLVQGVETGRGWGGGGILAAHCEGGWRVNGEGEGGGWKMRETEHCGHAWVVWEAGGWCCF